MAGTDDATTPIVGATDDPPWMKLGGDPLTDREKIAAQAGALAFGTVLHNTMGIPMEPLSHMLTGTLRTIMPTKAWREAHPGFAAELQRFGDDLALAVAAELRKATPAIIKATAADMPPRPHG